MDIVCFSHLRWNFVYQRPQHLLSRFARNRRVFYIEEPFFEAPDNSYSITETKEHVFVINLHLKGHPHEENVERQKQIISDAFAIIISSNTCFGIIHLWPCWLAII